MKLFRKNKYFVFSCKYEERYIAKKAGLSFDSGSGNWFTKDPLKAIRLRKYATEKLDKQFDQYLKYLRYKVNQSKKESSDIEIPKPNNGMEYKPFQKAGIELMTPLEGVLLGDQQGTGKTIQVIGVMNNIPDFKNAVIICPNSLKDNWKREMKNWLVHDVPIRICNTIDFQFFEEGVSIINYEAFRNNTTRGSKNYSKPKHGGKYNNTELVIRAMKKIKKFDLLALDESHNIKNYQANTTRNIFKIRKYFNKKILMTGTPFLNRPVELWTTIKFLGHQDKFGGTKKQFGYRYCDLQATDWGWDYRGSSNLKELQLKLRESFMIRRTRKQVLKELPPKSRKPVVVEISDAYKKHLSDYKKVVADLSSISLDKQEPTLNILSGINVNFEEIAQIKSIVGQAKILPVVEYTKEILDSGEKVVLFGTHTRVLEAYKRKFKKYNPVLIYGKVKVEDRQELIDTFKYDKNCRIIILNYDVGSVGYNLQESHNVVFAELNYVPQIMNQAEDRCNRLGSINPSVNHYILAQDTLDASIGYKIIEKQRVFDKAFETNKL